MRRFLILHRELDPDDDELTRTREVRRGFIREKYAVLRGDVAFVPPGSLPNDGKVIDDVRKYE